MGDPIDVVTGEVRDIALDFQIAGDRQFKWERFYQSFRADEDRGLGWGHRHALDWTLRFDLDGISLEGPEDPVRFPALWADGDKAIERGWTLTRVDARVHRAQRQGAPTLEFVRSNHRAVESRLERLLHGDGQTHLQYQQLKDQLRLVGVRDTGGWALHLEWQRGHLVAVHASGTFGNTTLTRYQYDQIGCLVRVVDAYGHTFSWAYDAFRRVARRTDPRGYAVLYQYDAQGRCVHVAGEDDVDAVSLVYLPDIYETRVLHGADRARWYYRYDPDGNLQEIEEPYGAKRQFLYNEQGLQTGETDLQGDLWTLLRDNTGQVTGKLDPLGYLRDPDEDPIDPEVNPFLEEYAACPLTQEFGEFIETEFELPKETVFAAKIPEPLRSVLWTQAEAGVVREVRDVQGLLLREERRFGDGRILTRSYAYDPSGNLVRLQDFDGGDWAFQIESWNHLVGYRAPTGAEFRITRSKTHKIVRFEDPGETVTEYEWDLCGRLIGVHRHGALQDRYVHDETGRFVEHRDGAGELLIAYERGPLDALMARTTCDGVEERFERDERGRIVEATTSTPWSIPCTINFEYDPWFHRLRDERDGSGVCHEYQLDKLTKTELRVAGRVFTIRYVQTDADTLQIEDPTGSTHHVRRVGPGVVLCEFANGTTELSQYDDRGLCLARATMGTTGVWRRRFVLSGEGDLLMRQDDRRGTSWHEYDAGHRLVATRREGAPIERYTYDLANNLRSKPGLSEGRLDQSSGGPHVKVKFGPEVALYRGNRLLSANEDRFVYDERHHMVRREGPWGSLTYTRDALGRLYRIERTESQQTQTKVAWEAEYDALGRRIRKTVHGADLSEHWEFYWDSDRLAAEILPDGRLRVYVYLDIVALVPMLAVEYTDAEATEGSVYVLQTDHRGAVERVEDGGGRVVWEAIVRPFGDASVLTGRNFHQPFRLVGQYHDEETGLSVTRFRYWSAELGRFLESDPAGLGGGTNLYAWPGCPLVDGDPLGLGLCPRCNKPNCLGCEQRNTDSGEANKTGKGKEDTSDGSEQRSAAREGRRGPHPRIEEGNLKEGWKHIDARHVTGDHPIKGPGDLFAAGTTRQDLKKAATLLLKKGTRATKNSKQALQTFYKRIKVNKQSKKETVQVTVDASDGNRVITIFPVRGGG